MAAAIAYFQRGLRPENCEVNREMRDGCEVVMPQMGDSIAEGTITKWLVEVGDLVDRDQPLFEIATDKVDAEIPSPFSGVLRQIHYPVGTTVPVNTVVAWIAPLGEYGKAVSHETEESSLSGTAQSFAQELPKLAPVATPTAETILQHTEDVLRDPAEHGKWWEAVQVASVSTLIEATAQLSATPASDKDRAAKIKARREAILSEIERRNARTIVHATQKLDAVTSKLTWVGLVLAVIGAIVAVLQVL
jgi:pyruvate/2-oxoglutarate dehydrogenase complex dihydrolipoamide acyltransferase (E2) component